MYELDYAFLKSMFLDTHINRHFSGNLLPGQIWAGEIRPSTQSVSFGAFNHSQARSTMDQRFRHGSERCDISFVMYRVVW